MNILVIGNGFDLEKGLTMKYGDGRVSLFD